MSLFITAYLISCIFVPHSKDRALKLRESYLKYVGLPILNIHIDIQGNPDITPALYVCNHRSFSDPVILCRYLKAFVIGKAEVANYPIINKGAELTGVIWVNRSDKSSRSATRVKMVETIQSGYNVLVFPEGTVCKDELTLSFRPGSFTEAIKHNIPVIPIALEYKSKRDLWLKEKFVPQYFYQFSKWRTHAKVRFGEPLYGSDGEKLAIEANQWIREQLIEMKKEFKRN